MQGKQFIRGSQSLGYETRMLGRVTKRVLNAIFAAYFLLVSGVLYITARFKIYTLAIFAYAYALNFLGYGQEIVYKSKYSVLRANYFLHSSDIQRAVLHAKNTIVADFVKASIISIAVEVILGFFVARFLIKKGKEHCLEKHIDGTYVECNPKKFIKLIKADKDGVSKVKLLSKFPIPTYSEFQGFLFHGATGTGKSQAIIFLLREIRRLGEPAIIYDKECSLKPDFFNKETDIELNPLSVDCANWILWSEANNPLDLGNQASYLIPKSLSGSDPFWVDSARTIFTTMAWKMRDRPDKNAILLLQFLLTSTLDEMRDILKGTESENLVSKEIEKMAISIKSVLATYTKSLRFLEGLDKDGKPEFSIKQWVKDALDSNKSNGGWLFITSRSMYHKEMKPLISLWLGLAMQSIQSLKPNSNKRIWLVMDELASLHRLEGLSDTLADIRKFGGCVAVGIQSISQLEFLYGMKEGHAIADSLNTSIFFRSPREYAAEWVSRELGKQTVEEVYESQSYAPNAARDGNTLTVQRKERRTVESTKIMTMKNRECYMRLVGTQAILKTRVKYIKHESNDEPLLERVIDFDALEKVNRLALALQNNNEVCEDVKKIQIFEAEANAMGEHEKAQDVQSTDALSKVQEVERISERTRF